MSHNANLAECGRGARPERLQRISCSRPAVSGRLPARRQSGVATSAGALNKMAQAGVAVLESDLDDVLFVR